MKTRQAQIHEELMGLLYGRFNEETLNERLSEIFGKQVKVGEATDEEWTGDWYYTLYVEDEEIGGYFDFYYLKMREQPIDSDDTLRFFITEIVTEFDY